jgi:hypothetical protein
MIIEQSIAAGIFPAPGLPELMAAHASLSECLRRLNLVAAGPPVGVASVTQPSAFNAEPCYGLDHLSE